MPRCFLKRLLCLVSNRCSHDSGSIGMHQMDIASTALERKAPAHPVLPGSVHHRRALSARVAYLKTSAGGKPRSIAFSGAAHVEQFRPLRLRHTATMPSL